MLSTTLQEVDIVAASFSSNAERELVADFTYPYYYETNSILLKKPHAHSRKWRTLIDPFHPLVLLCILISLPVSAFFLSLFEKYSPFYEKYRKRRNLRGLHQYSDSFWYMYGAVLTQGGEQMADSSTGRTFLSFWWIFCIIMMATYSGNLIASLSITKDILPFNSLQGLAEQDSYTYGLIGNSAYETLLKYSVLPYRRTIWENIVKFNATDPSVVSSNSDIQFQKVLEGNYAFIIDRTFIEHVMLDNCDLAKADQDFLPLPYSIGLPHDSPYTKIFTEKILSIQEGGLLNAWKLKHWPTSGLCEGKLQNTAKTVTLVDIQSAFYLIGIGIFIGTLTLFIEKLKRQL